MPRKKSTTKSTKKSSKTTSKAAKKDSVNINLSCEEKCCDSSCKKTCGGHGSSGLYFLGFIGALVYYISTATGFWNGVWGVVKAALWPAFVLFDLMRFLGM